MAPSVYDWMVSHKSPSHECEGRDPSSSEDVLVRILKLLDAEASKAPVPST